MRGNGGRHAGSLTLDRRGGSLVEYLIAVGLMAMLALAGVRRLGDGGAAKSQAHAACVEALDCAVSAAPEPVSGAPAGEASPPPPVAAAPPPRTVPPPPPPPREETWGEAALGYGAAAAGGAWSFAKGFGGAAWGTVTGLANVVAHPIETAKGVAFVVAHPVVTAGAIKDSVAKAWDEDPSAVLGAGVFEVATVVVAPAKIAKLAKAKYIAGTKTVDAGDEAAKAAAIAKAADKGGDSATIANAADDAKDPARAAAVAARTQRVAAVVQDLQNVATRSGGSVYQRLMSDPVLGAAYKDKVIGYASDVKARLDDIGTDYQKVNWRHTQEELGFARDVADQMGLGAQDRLRLYLSALGSDSVKLGPEAGAKANFLTHNVDAAAKMAEELPKHLDMANPVERAIAEGAIRDTLGHQISPPATIMTPITVGAIKKSLGELSESDAKLIASIEKKMSDPLNPKYATPDGSKIAFTPQEQALLDRTPVKAWYLPNGKTGDAVVAADSLANYTNYRKIVEIRGPDTFFQDATVFDSVASARRSFDDAMTVTNDAAKPLMHAGKEVAESAVEQAKQATEAWIRQQHPSGPVPYWDAPLAYPTKNGAPLTAAQQAQYEFAKQIRARYAEELGKAHARRP